jgi:GNAT superfamily N-acetyltransferase
MCADDEAFLFSLFCSVREETFAALDVRAEQREQLLQIQFDAQGHQYRSQYPNADFDLVLCDGNPIGSLYALRGPDEFVLIDIALLPEHRNCGIGAKLVETLIRQANDFNKPLEAHVLRDNPAWHLWQRLGFEEVSDNGIYMRIRAPANHVKAS